MEFISPSQTAFAVILIMACAAAFCAIAWIGIRMPGQSRTRACRLDEESRQRRRAAASGRFPQ